MERSQSSKRRRPVTACIECVRRKQKCDRQKPCNGCIARNVEDKCVFPAGLARPREAQVRSHEIPDLAVGLGYSPGNKITATLHSLQHSSGGEASPSSISSSGQQFQASHNLSRYHIVISQLPSETTVDQLVDVFFAEAGWYFCLVDRPYYDELLELWKACQSTTTDPGAQSDQVERRAFAGKKTTFVRHASEIRYFPAMLFQMLALALHFLPASCPTRQTLKLTEHSASDKLSKSWSDAGNEIMSTLGRIDSPITAVLADLLRCTWLKNSGLGGQSWHTLSDAVRQAQCLRLHKMTDIPHVEAAEDTLRNMWHEEHRRRVWVSVFSWDAHMALSLDRPRLIIVGDCTVVAPLDCDLPTKPFEIVPTAAGVAGQLSRYTSQLFKYSIGFLIHEALSSGALQSPCRDYSLVDTLHQKVNDLVKAIPAMHDQDISYSAQGSDYKDALRQRQQISIIASSFIMSLHRPHALHRAVSRSIAISAALDTLTACQSLFELCEEQHYKIHTVLFHTIDTVIFLSSMVIADCQDANAAGVHDISFPYYSIYNALFQAVKRVAEMRKRSDIAREAEKALRKCHELVARYESEYDQPNETTPLESIHSGSVTTTWTPSSDQDLLADTSISPHPSMNVGKSYGAGMLPTASYPHLFPEPVDTSSFDDLSEFLSNPEMINNAFHTSVWMEQQGFIDDTFLSWSPTLPEFS